MGRIKKPWGVALMPFLAASLLFTSGCAAVLLVGAGGAGGYMIRKGEETEETEKIEKTDKQDRSDDMHSSSKQKLAFLAEAGQEIVLPGGAK